MSGPVSSKPLVPIPVLYYHRVGKFHDKRGKLTVTSEDFAGQMETLNRLGFKVVTLDEVTRHPKTWGKIALTFDDGYKDTFLHALPVLKRYRFPATFFLVADYIGKKDIFNSATGLPSEDLLDTDEIHELIKAGMEIGSHSMTHAVLTELDDRSLEKEVLGSKERLESLLQRDISYFSYPKGLYSSHIVDCVFNAGYKAAFSTRNGDNKSLFSIKRIPVSSRDKTARFLLKLLKTAVR